jgi:hypothetical protein
MSRDFSSFDFPFAPIAQLMERWAGLGWARLQETWSPSPFPAIIQPKATCSPSPLSSSSFWSLIASQRSDLDLDFSRLPVSNP